MIYLKSEKPTKHAILAGEGELYLAGGTSLGEHFQPDDHLPDTGPVAETCANVTWMQLSMQPSKSYIYLHVDEPLHTSNTLDHLLLLLLLYYGPP